MSRYRSVIIGVLIFLSSCTHYQTTRYSPEPGLQPRILKGSITEIQSIAYEAARKAFPDETGNISVDGTKKISIMREWFWRGDTLITVSIEETQTDEFIINAESKASWHRMNPSALGVSRGEIADYFKSLDQEYASYLKTKNKDHSDKGDSIPLADRLEELKKAFDNGLITETEYEEKRNKMISDF